MAKDVNASAEEVTVPMVEALPPRIHIKQFLISYPDMSEMTKAAFRVFVGQKTWMRKEQWLQEFERFNNRDSDK